MMILPEDVIHEIFRMLPAKSVLICKCVCKTWFSLVSNPNFMKKHLDLIMQNKNKQSKFMFMIRDDTESHIYSLVSTVSYDDTLDSSSFESSSTQDNWDEIDDPLKDDLFPIHSLVGSCNGLICIMSYTSMVVIWNPATTEYKILPNPSQTKDFLSVYSFGYDHKNDDYKVLRIPSTFFKLPPNDQEDGHQVAAEVYSLESNSWTSVETIPNHVLKNIPHNSVYGVLVNGLRHWLSNALAKSRISGPWELGEEFIVSFDFREERFKQMHLPKAFLETTNFHFLWTLGVWDECLCVGNDVLEYGFQLEIWVMQDYGVRESWTKRFIIRQEELAKQLMTLRVIWSFKDDKILLMGEGERWLVLYDPKQDTVTKLKIRSSAVIRGAENYVESLVSLNSGIYVGSYASRAKRLRRF